jgi:hypothetical protein
VGKQRERLEYIRDSAFVNRHLFALLGVEPHLFSERNATTMGAYQPRDAR